MNPNFIFYNPLVGMSIKQRRPVVIEVLHTEPSSRDDDDLLEKLIWKKLGVQTVFYNRKLHRLVPDDRSGLPARDTITRIRRKLQEDGIYPCTSDEIRIKRRAYSKTVLSDLNYSRGL